MKNSHLRALRGDVEGWSVGAVRRNTQFLWSVREQDLTGAGVACTLTLKDCPPTAQAWHRLRRSWEKRMFRAGAIRIHWVTEWQRRGVPHLHVAIWWPDRYDTSTPIDAWLALAAAFGAGRKAQDAKPIDGVVGWFQYVSKHAARGVRHYQRSAENMPEGWRSKTGRVWGKVGQWSVEEGFRIDLQNHAGDRGYFAYRRLVRSWRMGDARASGDLYRIRSARSMLKSHHAPTSAVRGISEWIPMQVQQLFFANLLGRGYSVRVADPRKGSSSKTALQAP